MAHLLAHLARLALACLVGVPLGGVASADPLVPTLQTCTTINCGALVLPGRINAHPVAGIASPWVNKIAAAGAGCLRLHVVSESADLAMTVVGPDGRLYTNDNGAVAPCAACPKIVIQSPVNGVYTIVLNQRTGAPVEASFRLHAGRYAAASSNCLSPTAPK